MESVEQYLDVCAPFGKKSGMPETGNETSPEPTTSAPSEAEAKMRRRRPWLILCGLFILGLGVLGWLMFFHDDPPPDDADLIPQWSERGGKANPLAVFCDAISTSNIDLAWWPFLQKIRREDKPMPVAEKAALLEAHRAELDTLQVLLRTDPVTWQWPDAALMATYGTDFSPPYSKRLLPLASAHLMQAEVLAQEGKLEEAVQVCLANHRLGSGLLHAEGRLHCIFLSNIIHRMALARLQETLALSDAKPALLRHCLEDLAREPSAARDGLDFSLRVDYTWYKGAMPKTSNLELQGFSDSPERMRGHMRLFFKPNRTLTLKARRTRRLMDGLAHGWKAGLLAERTNVQEADGWYATRLTWRKYTIPNYAGTSLILFNGHMDSEVSRSLKNLTSRRQLLLMLALRLHELERGSLPGELEALVPGYLPAVPVDEYSGGPMKWDATRQVLYSVGENFTDDGGALSLERPNFAKDLGAIYWWSDLPVPLNPPIGKPAP